MNNIKISWHTAALALVALLCVSCAFAEERTTEQDPVKEENRLMAEVNLLFAQGKYFEAISPGEHAVALRERTLGLKHPATAASINMLGRVCRYAGEYFRAETLLQHALAIREDVLGPQHPDTADSLNNLAAVYHVMGNYKKAEPLYLRALAIRQKTLGLVHADTVISLNNLGLLYGAIGDYQRAELFLDRAMTVADKYQSSEQALTAMLLGNLGTLYAHSSYAKAEPLLLRALNIRETTLGPEHPDTATALRDLGFLYDLAGSFDKAEPLYQQALTIRQKRLGPEHPFTAQTLGDLGLLYTHTGAYARAEQLYRRAIDIQERTLIPDSLATANSLSNLARLYTRIRDYDRAEPLHLRTLAIRRNALGPDNLITAWSMSDLAELYFAMGVYDRAEIFNKRALEVKEHELGHDHANTANSLYDLAVLYARTSDARAEPLFLDALEIREKIFGVDHPSVAETLGGLGTLKWSEGESTKALQFFQRSQLIQAKNSTRFLMTGSEFRKQAYLVALANDTYKYVSFSVSVPGCASVGLGLENVLQYKGRVLDAVSDSVSHLRRSVRAEDQALFNERAAVANQISSLTYQSTSDLASRDFRARIEELAARQEKLDTTLAERSREFRTQIAAVTVEAVRRAIPKGAALVEWFRYVPFDPKAVPVEGQRPIRAASRYVAYVLKQGVDPIAIDIGDATDIDSMVSDFRQAASDSKHKDFRTTSTALSAKIWEPLSVHLHGVQHLLISPDGALNLIPMAALQNEQGEYLAQQYEISYLTSGRDLLRFDNKSSSPRTAVVVADPSFGKPTIFQVQANAELQAQRSVDLDRSGLIFRPLANTALEANDITKLLRLDPSNVFEREEATEAHLKQLHSPIILHVASHGFFLSDQELTSELKKRGVQDQDLRVGENPLLRSGIALAGANERHSGANEDGILTALEVAQLDLHGTELVVLSACDSGIGDVQNGEGVYGLRRALVLAGAQTQVTSLWKVSDEATRTLMVDFYQRLLKGEGRSAALRHAQLAMLANPELAHPYYWASFVPIGNWAPLPLKH